MGCTTYYACGLSSCPRCGYAPYKPVLKGSSSSKFTSPRTYHDEYTVGNPVTFRVGDKVTTDTASFKSSAVIVRIYTNQNGTYADLVWGTSTVVSPGYDLTYLVHVK